MNQTSSAQSHRTEPSGITPFGVLLKTVGIVIIIAILLLCLAAFIPPLFGFQTATIVSGSMEPEIPVDSIVYVKEADPEEIEPGEVIAFNTQGSPVIHRVVENKKDTGTYVTKGDANEVEDINEVSYLSLIGRVTHHYPVLGKVLNTYTDSTGRLYLLAIIVAGGLLDILSSVLKG